MSLDQEDVERLRIISFMLGSTWRRQGLSLQGSRPLPYALPLGLVVVIWGLLVLGVYWYIARGPGPPSGPPHALYIGGFLCFVGLSWMLVRLQRTLDSRTRILTGWSWHGCCSTGQPTRLGPIEAVVIERESRVMVYRKNPSTNVEDVDHVWLQDPEGGRILMDKKSRDFQAERFFPVGCLCARSDRVEACFGGSLDEANLEYLRALLVNRIVELTRSG